MRGSAPKSLHRVTSVLAVSPHPMFDLLMDNSGPFSRGDRDGATMSAAFTVKMSAPVRRLVPAWPNSKPSLFPKTRTNL
jgi:hypothetical protein